MRVYPNPLNAVTNIVVELATSSNVKIDIYDVNGKHVDTVWQGSMASGTRTFSWDARDGLRQRLASSVYFVRAESNGVLTAVKLVVVR